MKKSIKLMKLVKEGKTRGEMLAILMQRYKEKKALRKLAQWPDGQVLRANEKMYKLRVWIFGAIVIADRLVKIIVEAPEEDLFGPIGLVVYSLLIMILWFELLRQLRYGNKAMLGLAWISSIITVITTIGSIFVDPNLTWFSLIWSLVFAGIMLYLFIGFNTVWKKFFPEGLSRLKREHLQ